MALPVTIENIALPGMLVTGGGNVGNPIVCLPQAIGAVQEVRRDRVF